MKLLSAECSWL